MVGVFTFFKITVHSADNLESFIKTKDLLQVNNIFLYQ